MSLLGQGDKRMPENLDTECPAMIRTSKLECVGVWHPSSPSLRTTDGLSKSFWYYFYKAKRNKMFSKLELTRPNYYCSLKIFTLESCILKNAVKISAIFCTLAVKLPDSGGTVFEYSQSGN